MRGMEGPLPAAGICMKEVGVWGECWGAGSRFPVFAFYVGSRVDLLSFFGTGAGALVCGDWGQKVG